MGEHRCERHVEAEDESRTATRPCGRAAEWYTEDYRVAPDGLWLCESHQREVALRVDDDVAFDAVTP